jgi:hypothetical protein
MSKFSGYKFLTFDKPGVGVKGRKISKEMVPLKGFELLASE